MYVPGQEKSISLCNRNESDLALMTLKRYFGYSW